MSTNPDETVRTYKACSAQTFRAEFGVCRGEGISRLEDLCLGDIYQFKHPTDWMPVTPVDGGDTEFTLSRAANLAATRLTGLAKMIFMTTTGRRSDVIAAFSDSQLFLVSDTELAIGPEYVLIDLEILDVDFTPAILPAPAAPILSHTRDTAEVLPFRMYG